jgi:hypothetical protein
MLHLHGWNVILCTVRLLNLILQIPRMTQIHTVGRSRGLLGLVTSAIGGLRFDSLGVSLLFSGRDPASGNNMVASVVTMWLRSETRVWIGNKQTRTFLQQYRHIKERGKSWKIKKGEWVGRERLEGNQGQFCEAGGLPYSCTWWGRSGADPIQNLAEISRSSKGAPWRVAGPAQISDALANCNVNVSSM